MPPPHKSINLSLNCEKISQIFKNVFLEKIKNGLILKFAYARNLAKKVLPSSFKFLPLKYFLPKAMI